MPQLRPFAQVDVFTAQPYLGNPLAVVLDGSGLTDAQMQSFARWTNLSETTFLLPPTPEAAAQGADYRVRIFTPGGELPFAGHPTLGSCHAWLEAGGAPRAKDRIVQECAKGLVQICRDGTRLAFAAPSFQRKNPSPGLLAQVTKDSDGTLLGNRPDRSDEELRAWYRAMAGSRLFDTLTLRMQRRGAERACQTQARHQLRNPRHGVTVG